MVLADEVLKYMLVSRVRLVMLALMFVGAAAAGGGLASQLLARQAGKPNLPHVAGRADDGVDVAGMDVADRVRFSSSS